MLFLFTIFLKLERTREIEFIFSLTCKCYPLYKVWAFHLNLLLWFFPHYARVRGFKGSRVKVFLIPYHVTWTLGSLNPLSTFIIYHETQISGISIIPIFL